MGWIHTPKTWGAELLTSSDLNAEVADFSAGVQDSWESYTPDWLSTGTAPDLGNGVLTGEFWQVGKTCKVRIQLKFGSTTDPGTGFYNFSLPADFDLDRGDAMGSGSVVDNSTDDEYGFTATYDGAGNVRLWSGAAERVGHSFPIALADFDHITVMVQGQLV